MWAQSQSKSKNVWSLWVCINPAFIWMVDFSCLAFKWKLKIQHPLWDQTTLSALHRSLPFLIQHSPGPGGMHCIVSGEAQVGWTPQDAQAPKTISLRWKKVSPCPLTLWLAALNHLCIWEQFSHWGSQVTKKTMPDMFERGGNWGFFSITRESSPCVFSFCKDIERTLRPFPSGAVHEPSQALHTQSEIKPPSETLQQKFTDTPSLNGTVLEQEKETQEVLLLTRRTSVQNPGAHSHQAKTVSEFPQSVEKESTSQP